MNYYIGSTIMIDNLYFDNGNTIQGVAGGAGIYALIGGKLWTDNMCLVCGVGDNFVFKFLKWFRKNDLSMKFLKRMDVDTPINKIIYYKDGTKKEKRLLNEKHDNNFEYSKNDFKEHLREDCAIYIFKNTDRDFWEPLTKEKSATVLWKITHDACRKENLTQIHNILKNIDVFSINLSYAKDLYETKEIDVIIKELYKFKVPLVHIVSEEGQYLLKFNRSVFVPLSLEEPIVDVTGGDHASASAVLVGIVQNEKLFKIGQMANHSYNMVTSQFGLPEYVQEYKNYMELKGR